MHLFEKLKPDSIILTVNRRLASTLLKKYHVDQISQGLTHWPTLKILPYQAWLTELWQTLHCTHIAKRPLLLSQIQEQILWEDILRQSKNNIPLLQPSESAILARSAWGILKQWQVTLDATSFQATEDTTVFYSWAMEFMRLCQQNDWIDHYSLATEIMLALQKKQLSAPQHLYVVGFTELSPEQKKSF